MKFLLDENVDVRLADFLLDRGHDVTSISRDYSTALDVIIDRLSQVLDAYAGRLDQFIAVTDLRSRVRS